MPLRPIPPAHQPQSLYPPTAITQLIVFSFHLRDEGQIQYCQNGNHQTLKEYVFMNQRDAKDWEIAERARINVGRMRSDKTITVAEYLEWWHGSFVW